MKVKTVYNRKDYITPHKTYVVETRGVEELIIDDDGDKIGIVGPEWGTPCPHLDNVGFWELAS